MILHQQARSMGPVAFVDQHIARCGARRADGAMFTFKGSLVSCPECKAHLLASRARAQATFAAVLAGMAK